MQNRANGMVPEMNPYTKMGKTIDEDDVCICCAKKERNNFPTFKLPNYKTET